MVFVQTVSRLPRRDTLAEVATTKKNHWLREARETLPAQPGIYRFVDERGTTVYVGKATHLRRRIGQYVNAKRVKKHRKMGTIVRSAATLEYEVCATPLDARLRELALIQSLRPKWNVEGAFHFLYPMVGIDGEDRVLRLALTTHPDAFRDAGFGGSWHGAFRSRELTRGGFFALTSLLRHLSHREKWAGPPTPCPPHSFRLAFRFATPPERTLWQERVHDFFQTGARSFCGEVSLALLDHPGARARAGETEELLRELERFRRHEVRPLRQALGPEQPFVRQEERDTLFARARHAVAAR